MRKCVLTLISTLILAAASVHAQVQGGDDDIVNTTTAGAFHISLPITWRTTVRYIWDVRPLDGGLWVGETCDTDADCDEIAGEPLWTNF